MSKPDAVIDALPSAYVPAISQHVQSVEPSKQVMSQYWCPVVVKGEQGDHHVLHVDPIAVRCFRRSIAEELQHVQEKRRRMLRRIRDIRQELPQPLARDIAARLRHEVADARHRAEDPLIHALPSSTRTLHVLLEVSAHMTQLGLICEQLLRELPTELARAGVEQVSFTALGGFSGAGGCAVPALEPLGCDDPATLGMAADWLRGVCATAAAKRKKGVPSKQKFGKGGSGGGPGAGGLRLAKALCWATTADALSEDGSTVLLVVCSCPLDLEESSGLLRRSGAVLQVAGVFGSSPEDPEPALQQLVDNAAPGSSLRLFFGPWYWSQFISAREKKLELLRNEGEGAMPDKCSDDDDREIVSTKVFEMRLIERVMRECYAEEQQCEEEIACAGRVLERSLVDREDILAVLRQQRPGPVSQSPALTPGPATAR